MNEREKFEIRSAILKAGIDYEEYIAKQANQIDELVNMLERVDIYERGAMLSPLYKHELRTLIAKHRGKRYERD